MTGIARGLVVQLAVALLVWSALLGSSGAAEPRMTVEDGRVSATFVATPARGALEAVRAATRVEVVLPPPAGYRWIGLAAVNRTRWGPCRSSC